ncbi:MAG: hypothetical protein Q8L90_10885 [Bacteroidota bacterium]|nr:hypothetical protein [Bacteroidota bacterium]
MMLLLLSLLAHADHAHANSGPVDSQGDFLVAPREDAPTDGLLLFDANFELDATVVEGPGAPLALPGLMLLGYMSGNETIVTFAPEAGWEAGAAYVVEVGIQGYDADDLPGQIAFTVGSEPAPAPSAPLVVSAAAADWSDEEEEHAWGCCDHTREVSFEVESTADDPWAYVELTGLFEGEGQIAETPLLHRLDVGIGPGTHTLRYRQWEEGGVPKPPAFEVAPVSSSGVRGEAQRFDFAEEPAPPLCGTSGAAGFAPLALALLLVRRRTT